MTSTESYYAHPRPEILDVVPLDVVKVLELGCASGEFGATLKLRQPLTRITGLEFNTHAAELAKTRLDEVITTDIDSYQFTWEPGTFDCVIAADVLEHLRDPWRVLGMVRQVLSDAGCLIVSIPNAANHNILWQLANGRFDYVDEGLLDRTHLRFFTRQTFSEALDAAGFTITSVTPIFDDIYQNIPEDLKTKGGQFTLGTVQVNCPDALAVENLMAYQIIFVARRKLD